MIYTPIRIHVKQLTREFDLGKAFILSLKEMVPFPLDEFPKASEAGALLKPFGLKIETFIDQPELYILVATK